MEGKAGCFSKEVVAILATKMSECLLGGGGGGGGVCMIEGETGWGGLCICPGGL